MHLKTESFDWTRCVRAGGADTHLGDAHQAPSLFSEQQLMRGQDHAGRLKPASSHARCSKLASPNSAAQRWR